MPLALLIVAALIAAIPAVVYSWYPLACCGSIVLAINAAHAQSILC
jgi:hypothetical protein